MKEIYLTLPWPPTSNSYHTHTKRGIFISKKGRAFRDAVVRESIEQSAYNLKIDLRLNFDVILYPPNRRICDLDNRIKALQDSLSFSTKQPLAGVWGDDAQIDYLQVYRGVIVPNGRCLIRVSEFHGMILPYIGQDIWDVLQD